MYIYIYTQHWRRLTQLIKSLVHRVKYKLSVRYRDLYGRTRDIIIMYSWVEYNWLCIVYAVVLLSFPTFNIAAVYIGLTYYVKTTKIHLTYVCIWINWNLCYTIDIIIFVSILKIYSKGTSGANLKRTIIKIWLRRSRMWAKKFLPAARLTRPRFHALPLQTVEMSSENIVVY